LEQFRGGPAQSQYKQGYNALDHQYQPPKIKEEGGRKENNNASKFGLIFSFSFSLFSAFVQVYICVTFCVFIYFHV
jgi:hypothetical protein